MATVHPELSSFLTDVWENRDHILFGPQAKGEERDTVEDRVYDIYASTASRVGGVTPDDYDQAVRGLVPIGRGWPRDKRGGFYVWTAPIGGSASHRLYLNVKPEHTAAAMKALFACAASTPMATTRPPVPRFPTERLPEPKLSSQVVASAVMSSMQRGHFADVVVAAKVADKVQAFTGRADKMLVYLNDLAGEAAAHLLARKLGTRADWFAPDIPPMTRRLAWGIACGPEVSGAQWNAGTSFGEVRCNLIARALIETVTGNPVAALSESQMTSHPSNKFQVVLAPLPYLRPTPRVGATPGRSPNRLDFVALVSDLFAKHQIDPQAPWAQRG